MSVRYIYIASTYGEYIVNISCVYSLNVTVWLSYVLV